MYTIESMETNGPKEEVLSLDEAVVKLNTELKNGRVIFIDGSPIQVDIITPEIVKSTTDTISIMNKLIGG